MIRGNHRNAVDRPEWDRRPREVALVTGDGVIEIGLRDLETLIAIERLSKRGVCRAPYSRIAALSGVCVSTASRACWRLADNGFIVTEKAFDPRGSQKPNVITITDKGSSALSAVSTATACSRKHD